MGYKVIWNSKPLRFLDKLNQQDSFRIFNKIDSILLNPIRYLEHFEGENLYKIRIGDYRLLVDVDKNEKISVIQVLDKKEGAIRDK